jgi:phage-related protein
MDKFYWVDANGLEYPISDNHLIITGPEGRFMPPISFTEEEVPFAAGTRLRNVKVGAREFDLSIYIDGVSEADARAKTRNLLRVFNPLVGDGKIKVAATDGTQREINCRYSSGLEISEKDSAKIGNMQAVVLVFRAFDPYWYDSVTQVLTFNTGQPATFFPFPPLRLSSSSVFADTSIDNTGDVEAYPEWIVTGPGNGIVLRNYTTGEMIELDVTLGIGESVTIDTRPFVKTVTKNDGTNLFYTLSDASSLWTLQPGVNSVRLEMSDATDQSSIQLSYKNRYWGP